MCLLHVSCGCSPVRLAVPAGGVCTSPEEAGQTTVSQVCRTKSAYLVSPVTSPSRVPLTAPHGYLGVPVQQWLPCPSATGGRGTLLSALGLPAGATSAQWRCVAWLCLLSPRLLLLSHPSLLSLYSSPLTILSLFSAVSSCAVL